MQCEAVLDHHRRQGALQSSVEEREQQEDSLVLEAENSLNGLRRNWGRVRAAGCHGLLRRCPFASCFAFQ